LIGSPFISSELVVENLSRREEVYRFVFDPTLIPENELVQLIRTVKELKRGKTCRELIGEAGRVLDKVIADVPDRVWTPLLLDPAMRAGLHIIVNEWSIRDIGIWWCDRRQKGRLFTDPLCTGPSLGIKASGRRAVALNPWSLSEISDLDTIIDSRGYHKGGTIGTSPFSFTRALSKNSASIQATFVARTSTTVKSIILLIPSMYGPWYSSSCFPRTPAPRGTCNPDYYESVYLPLWGWDVTFDIVEGEPYAVKIKLYI